MINQYLNNIVNQSTLYAPNSGADGGLNEAAIDAGHNGHEIVPARRKIPITPPIIYSLNEEAINADYNPLDDGLTPDEMTPRQAPMPLTPNV